MTLVKASMKVIITTIIAGAFLVAATALHARITPHLIALPRGAVVLASVWPALFARWEDTILRSPRPTAPFAGWR